MLSLERAEWVLSNFDLQALEAGVRMVETGGGKVTVLSAGPKQINQSKLKKDVLSRGPDELVMVVDDALANADTAATSTVLAAAVRKMEGVDLVLCGEGSADLYFQQVGLQLGERLGLPTFNAIRKIETDGQVLSWSVTWKMRSRCWKYRYRQCSPSPPISTRRACPP
jgi:electron transfer flavoprotein beta subunit